MRYGIRKPGTKLIEDSLRVVDAALKADLPQGPCWRRYTLDTYGEHDDGSPFGQWGVGHPWPLLTGERGHYELAAGRDPSPYIRAMEAFASRGGLLPEQVWDRPDIPARGLHLGRPTGSARPLVWAHAEYVKLLRPARDGRVFDCIPAVAERYLEGGGRKDLEIWKFSRQVQSRLPHIDPASASPGPLPPSLEQGPVANRRRRGFRRQPPRHSLRRYPRRRQTRRENPFHVLLADIRQLGGKDFEVKVT